MNLLNAYERSQITGLRLEIIVKTFCVARRLLKEYKAS